MHGAPATWVRLFVAPVDRDQAHACVHGYVWGCRVHSCGVAPRNLTAPPDAGQVGAGAFDLCAGAIASTLFPGDAEAGGDGGSRGPCPCGGCDGVGGIPRIEFEGRLMATENFARAAAGLQLREDASLRELAEAASRHCATPWPTIAQVPPPPAP